ncbi:MAG: Maf family nucleotide pyrophosphatase [Crocinitomicaceae bacterium]|nr:septum formation protein Maf [Crocinitomicaceae bacterium]OUT68964.1 MAG: septum formation protein Maf [Crocinitomicaceae bacterium TMED16]
MEIILGSASPRRKELLKQMGFDFSVQISAVKEIYDPSTPAKQVASVLAKLKADALKKTIKPGQLLICCDTVVIMNNEILGKPKSANDARDTLKRLSGTKHEVISAVCMVHNGKTIEFKDSTRIEFKLLSTTEIDYYVNNYKPFDKAGSYGIQEWIGHIAVSKIEGSYTNVMGLPTQVLYQEIEKLKN